MQIQTRQLRFRASRPVFGDSACRLLWLAAETDLDYFAQGWIVIGGNGLCGKVTALRVARAHFTLHKALYVAQREAPGRNAEY